MKKLLLTTLAVLLSLSLFGRSRERVENPAIVDARVSYAILDFLRDEGYTVLPEVHVIAYRNPQDTIKHKQQRFSSRFETKGGRGYRLPEWANDSTWYPGQKEPKKEFDDLYFNPKTDQQRPPKHRDRVDQIVDTLVKENPDIQVNNYYTDDPFFYSNHIGMFYHGGFNYWRYNPFFYDPWDFDYGWGWNPYYGYNYPYWSYPYYNSFYFGYNSYWGWNFGWNWGWNWYRPYYWYGHNDYYWHNNYYGHNNFYSYNQQPQYGRRERPSTLSNTQFNNRRVQPQERRTVSSFSQQRINPQDKPTYNQNRRSYSPSYNQPRMSERPLFNNTRVNNERNMNNVQNRRTEISTQIRTQSRTYQPTNRGSNYSVPSRSYSPPANRSSQPQGFGRTFNFNSGGSSNRSSSSGSFNSGGGSSSHSSGGRSSGGGSTGRR